MSSLGNNPAKTERVMILDGSETVQTVYQVQTGTADGLSGPIASTTLDHGMVR